MYLTRLALTDFRSYARLDLDLVPGVNLFLGANGNGKTNLLEAVEYLASLGSHRVATDQPLIRAGQAAATLSAKVMAGRGDNRSLSLDLTIQASGANQARLGGAPVRPRALLGAIQVVVFAPEDLVIARGEPGDRRRFIDGLVVARWPRLAGVKTDYDKVLRQKTALLKAMSGRSVRRAGAGAEETLDLWDEQLAALGAELVAARQRTLLDLAPGVAAHYGTIAPVAAVAELAYQSAVVVPPADDALVESRVVPRSVDDELAEPTAVPTTVAEDLAEPAATAGRSTESPQSPTEDVAGSAHPSADATSTSQLTTALRDLMQRRRGDEVDRGICLVGPHRDDVALSLDGLPVKGYASHGEGWSFVLALRLASLDLLQADGLDPILLLDDVFAELDRERRRRLVAAMATVEQTLITAAVADDVPSDLTGTVYQVTPGQVGPPAAWGQS